MFNAPTMWHRKHSYYSLLVTLSRVTESLQGTERCLGNCIPNEPLLFAYPHRD